MSLTTTDVALLLEADLYSVVYVSGEDKKMRMAFRIPTCHDAAQHNAALLRFRSAGIFEDGDVMYWLSGVIPADKIECAKAAFEFVPAVEMLDG